MRKGCLISLIISGLLILIIGIMFYRIFLIPKGIKIDKEKYPVTGIDVSMHSGHIDWQKIKNQNVDFAIIKATEGESYTDPTFLTNFNAAKEAGINTGVYHFFRFNKSGLLQARNFISHVKSYSYQLPPVVDIEEWGNYFSGKSSIEINDEIKIFIESVEEQFGVKIIIYTNASTYSKFIKNKFPNNPIWICSFDKNPKLTDNRKWLFWQHAHNGKLNGIKGYVDIDTFNGSKSEFETYFLKK